MSQSRSFFCRSLCCSSPCLFLSLVPFLCTTIHSLQRWKGRERRGKRTGRRLGATASAWSDARRGRLGPGVRAEGPRRGCSMGERRADWRPRARCAGRRRGRDRGLARRRGAAARRRARARAEEVERVPLVGRFGSSLILGVTRPAKELEHGAPRVPGQLVAERKGGDGGGGERERERRERGRGRSKEMGGRAWERTHCKPRLCWFDCLQLQPPCGAGKRGVAKLFTALSARRFLPPSVLAQLEIASTVP